MTWREDDMKKIVSFALVIALVGTLGAWAGETSGKIQSVGPVDRAGVLDDGTKLWVAEGLPLDALREGDQLRPAARAAERAPGRPGARCASVRTSRAPRRRGRTMWADRRRPRASSSPAGRMTV